MAASVLGTGTLADLARIRPARRRRVSSHDRTGGNDDSWSIAPGEEKCIAEITGAGSIKHIWCTIGCHEPHFARKIVLRAYWDGEATPSVEVPIGDFFGIGHGIIKNFWSLPLTMSPAGGRGFNCYFPMPYASGARFTVQNDCDDSIRFYFYVDYEEVDGIDGDLGRFHAQWRRENPTDQWGEGRSIPDLWKVPNLDGKDNYVILEAEGRGHYVGCVLNVDQFSPQKNDWYGEGDDMIFIDGDTTPTLHGTGTEDYFNTAYCPSEEFCTPYHGLTVNESPRWHGKNSMYRFHIEDPVHFSQSIRVTIEHGHANKLGNDYSSTAYWYQTEPHAAFPLLLPVAARLPRPSDYL